MKLFLSIGIGLLALGGFATTTLAQTRMQVSAGSAAIYAQPIASAVKMGTAGPGEILFVSRLEGDWVAISPPDRFNLWLNKDFIEGNRVIAKSIQVRAGPGVQYDVVGTLERGAPVMPRGEDGDWCKIAPPSSATLWVKKSDLSEVLTHASPIREVATVVEPPKPVPAPAPSAPVPPPAPAPIPAVLAVARPPEPPPALQVAAQPVAAPAMPVKIAPSNPNPSAPRPVPAPAPAPVAPESIPPAAQRPPTPQPSQAVASRPTASAMPMLRPATALPGPAPLSSAPVRRPPAMSAGSKSVPAPASAVTAQKSRNVEVNVDPVLVDDLDLVDLPNQGKAIQIEGELRNAPFMSASPSRYRLVDEDEDGLLQMVCHIHGDPHVLRLYVGQGVSIRGREYWVESSDMPVVVVGQIVPLAPADEPVMF